MTEIIPPPIMEYDFPEHRRGDTFVGIRFTLEVNGAPLDLTGATITMDLRKQGKTVRSLRISTKESIGGITIITPEEGIFEIDPQIIDVPAGVYDYDIEFELANEDVKTYIYGIWPIIQDVTNG